MADYRVLKVTVTGDVASFQRSLNQSAAASDQLGKKLGALGGNISSVITLTKGLILYEAIKKAFDAFAGVEKFDSDLQNLTNLLQGNAKAASTWLAVGDLLGISVETIDKAVVHLSTSMNTGSATLKQMGINASDARGRLKPVNDVLLEAVDYFQRHAGASNNAALANGLFGRSGYELLPILEQGRAGLAAISAEAAKYGLIIDEAGVRKNAAFAAQLRVAGMAVKGLTIGLGNALLPAVTALAMGLAGLVQQNLPALIAMINRAVSYVIGFIEGLTGTKIEVSKLATDLAGLASTTDDTGTAMDKSGAASARLAAAIDKVKAKTKAATDAIDAQIKKLNDQKAAQSFMDQQAKLQQDLANKSRDIDKLRADQYQQFWLGNFSTAADIGDQITRAQQDQANIQLESTRNTEDEQTKVKVDALEKQKQSIQAAADKQIAAMQKAAKGTTDAMAAGFGGIPALAGKSGKDSQFKFVKDFDAAKTGAQIGEQLKSALAGGDWTKIGKVIGMAIGQGVGTALGPAISEAIRVSLSAALHSLGNLVAALAQKLNSIPGFNNLMPGVVGGLQGEASVLRQFHQGGYVPGSASQDFPAMLRGRELVLTEQQQATIGAGPDMSTVEQLLRQVVALLAAGQRSGSGTGTEAALSNLMERASGNRRRVGAGSFAY